MIIFTIMILKLIVFLDLWLGIIDISNIKHANKIDEESLHMA